MSSVRIARVPILPFNMVNAHLVVGPKGCITVDAGLPGSERHFKRVLDHLGFGFSDIKLIIVTHAHVDHAGGAAALQQASGAPILAHAGDLPHYLQETPMTFCPTGTFGRLFRLTGLITQPFTPFRPDILLNDDDKFDLMPYGVVGMVQPTSGHTAGSISVTLDDGTALVGDLIASGMLLGGIAHIGHAIRPPFEDDPQKVGRALLDLTRDGLSRFYMGHGGPLPAAEVERHARRLIAMRS